MKIDAMEKKSVLDSFLYNIKRIKENIKLIKKLPKIKGVKEIMYPGQNKFNRFTQNLKKEISIPDIIKKDIEILIKK